MFDIQNAPILPTVGRAEKSRWTDPVTVSASELVGSSLRVREEDARPERPRQLKIGGPCVVEAGTALCRRALQEIMREGKPCWGGE